MCASKSFQRSVKPFEQIIENAGYEPWPNLIKNLRLSCENEWLDRGEAPAHVIAARIGHDIEVQNSSYAIVSDGHFEQFNQRTQTPSKSGNHSGNKQPRTDANSRKMELPPMLPPKQKSTKPLKKHGPKTVLDALERTRTMLI